MAHPGNQILDEEHSKVLSIMMVKEKQQKLLQKIFC
jgi:hypothetical protein